jgi:putative DNA-invertase from lambdoid prophage Rac
MARKRPVRPAAEIVRPINPPSPTDPAVTWGYARISGADQTHASQTVALAAAGIDPGRIVIETVSGAVAAATRPVLAGLLAALRSGDTLAAVRLDRVGRDPADVLAVARDLDRRGVRLRLLDLGADTGTPAGRVLLAVLAAVAGWERETLIERTREGLAAARKRGQPLGRHPALTQAQRAHAAELATAGHSIRDVARRLGCGPTVAHRAILASRTIA